MGTLEFVSTSAGGVVDSSAALVTAPTLISGLGSHPTLTLPLVCGREPDIELSWHRLDETGRFYGIAIPRADALRDTLHGFLEEAAARHGQVTLAARVLVVEVAGRLQFVVSASVIDPVRPEPVTLAVRSGPDGAVGPQWRQMAARTSSHADDDLTERELRAGGHADVVPVDGDRVGCPRLGALIIETPHGTIGTGSARLALLHAAGLLDEVTCGETSVAMSGATWARWVSPRFETHPVTAIGAHRFQNGEHVHE
jgi:hypothetical protein